jgi:retron-type reverse transcriptase
VKRAANLWGRLTAWQNLLECARAAARGKRKRPDVARYLLELEGNLCRLQASLLDDTYRPAAYRTFWIRDPKPRQISAAPFRDRVVHHALTSTLEPVFEPRFCDFSFASRQGFGRHKALLLARRACRTHRYVLKCDIRKYFPSIDHAILRGLLGRAVKCPATLRLASRIIDGSNQQEEALAYFAGDDLFSVVERRRGLPIGNQTSQFFANVYLNPLDRFVLRELGPARYLRYVDDFLLFGDDKGELRAMRQHIGEQLAGLRLRLHEGKSRVYRCAEGVTFLGWRLLPQQARLARGNVLRMRRRLQAMARQYHAGLLSFAAINARLQAWLGHASFGDTWHLRESPFQGFILGGAERPICAGVPGTTIQGTSASRTETGTSQRTVTTISAFVVVGMRSAVKTAGRNRILHAECGRAHSASGPLVPARTDPAAPNSKRGWAFW